MATFAEIKARVANELDREDLSSEIETAVLDAVDEHADLDLGFNEDRVTTVTVGGQRTVARPVGLRRETLVSIDVSGNDYELSKASAEFMEQLHNATDTQSQPSYYAFLSDEWHLWPTPDQAYTLTVLGIYDQTPLVASSDTNEFLTNRTAARMIAAWSRAYIARNVTYDDAMEKSALREYALARAGLVRKANANQATGSILPCL